VGYSIPTGITLVSAARERYAARLIALAERHPRRAGRFAMAAMVVPDLTGSELLALGWALLRWERLPEAQTTLEAAAARLSRAANAQTLHCARACLMLRQLRGEGAALQADWVRHVGQCARAGDLAELARARCEQIAHLNLLGRFEEARALAQQSLALVEQHGGSPELARHRHVAGVAASGCGDFATADTLLSSARAAFARLRHPADVARAHFERAWLHVRREKLDAARRDLEAALAIYQRLDLPFRVALCQRDLGSVAIHRGDYGRAIAQFVHARERFAAIGRADLANACDFNLGAVAHLCGLHDLALVAYRLAQQRYTALDDHAHALMAARNEALVLCALGRADEALRLVAQLAAQSQTLGDQLEHAELLSVRARAIRVLGDVTEASATFHEALAQFTALGNGPAAGECRIELGWLALEHGQLEAAEQHFRAAEQALTEQPPYVWRVYYGLGRVAEACGHTREALEHYAAAVALVAQLRRRLASEHASSRLFALARQLHLDATRLAATLDDAGMLLVLAEQQRGLALARYAQSLGRSPHSAAAASETQALDALRARLAGSQAAADLNAALETYVAALLQSRHHLDEADVAPTTLDLDQLRAALNQRYGTGWSLLAPVFADDLLLLVCLTPDCLWVERQPHDAELRRLLERACEPSYRMEVYRDLARLRDPGRQPWLNLTLLGERLLPARIRERLAPEHRLLILPSGPLHSLAWAALRLASAWLCERALVEVLPGLSFVPMHSPRTQKCDALLIGCDTFGARAAALPGALTSLALVAERWRGPITQLAGAEATCTAINELSHTGALCRYGLIHIAAHAQLGAADGLLAHIKLADRDLLLDEVLRLSFDQPLVVLAACEGGAGAVLPGDEVLGLSRALIAAGASAVLASLWPVYDRSVLALLAPFYTALAAGADAAEALAHAQRTLIRSNQHDAVGALLATPLVWGGFSVTSGGGTQAIRDASEA
jgi:tetratricopeptide (TPR) repeat protein